MEIVRDSQTSQKESSRSEKLFDDEGFTLTDSTARREIYKPLGKKEKKNIKAIIAFNLTKNHFKTNGAAAFSELKDEVRVLVDSLFNSLAYATDKKTRISQTPKEKKTAASKARDEQEKKKRKTVPSSSEREEEVRQNEAAVEEMEVESSEKKMNGNRHLRFEVESLLEKISPRESHMRVVGFRIWVFDSSNNAKELDLVTKGLKESFIESGYIHQQIQDQIAAHNKTQTRMKKHLQRIMEKSPKYLYTDYRNDSLYLNQVCNYFTSDDNHSTSKTRDGDNHYQDTREFFKSHGDGGKIGQGGERMPTLFSKESAMFSHVEQANVCPQQRCLESYFGEDIFDIEDALARVRDNGKNPKRYSLLVGDKIGDDAEFKQYPFPSVTYRVKCNRLSHDLFSVMPLPHRIGSILYNEEDRFSFYKQLRRIDNASQCEGSEEEEQEEEEEEVSREKPLGLHDTEEEIVINHFQAYKDSLSSVMKECLTKGTSIYSLQPNELINFRKKVSGKVRKDLMMINDHIRSHKKDLVVLRSMTSQPGTGEPPERIGFYSKTLPSEGKLSIDKKYIICRKLASIRGLDDNAAIKERRVKLADADLAYFTPIISQFRPVEATMENVRNVVGRTKYDETYMERDIFLVLDTLNEYGFQNIDKKYYDEDGRIKEGKGDEYDKTRRLFIEAITAEYWDHFFKNGRVSMAHMGIRTDLLGKPTPEGKRKRYGRVLPVASFNMQTRPYGIFKEWVYSYFRDYLAINHHYKTMNSLYFAKFHHCRSYAPGAKDPKLNFVLHGQGMGGKSHRLNGVKDSCPTGVCNAITHWTAQIFNTDMNLNDMLIIYEELSNKLIAPSTGKGGSSEAANDDARNNFKEQSTAGETKTASYFQDEETGDRKVKFSKCQCQNVILGATNNDLTRSDPNVMTRFIVDAVPKSKNEIIGTRAHDLMRHRMGVDTKKSAEIIEEHRELHRVYFMIEQFIKSGILGDPYYGTTIDNADTLIKEILDTLEAKFGIKTGDLRKRKHVIEMARCMCIAYAVWYGLFSPLTRHLQHDPETNEFIGFNPRVILEGIVPHLVVTKDMVIDSLTTLSCLWGHQSADIILENIATKQCQLHKLRESDFSRKHKSDTSAIGASTGIPSTSLTKKKTKISIVGDLNNDEPVVIDYNFILLQGATKSKMHQFISQNLEGELCISEDDVSKVLHEISKTPHECDGYDMVNGKLVRLDDREKRIKRKVIDYGLDINGHYCMSISVAYLKQKLPHLFPDSLIENASLVTHKSLIVNEGDMEVEDRAMRDQIMDTICIRPNSAQEDSMIKSIRYVLENSVLEYCPTEKEQFDYDMDKYRDFELDIVPWLNFITANHPPSMSTELLYPDIYDAYSKQPQHNKELSLADQMSILQLRRNPEGRPIVIYNYNPVAPTTKASLSAYHYENENKPEFDEDDPDAVKNMWIDYYEKQEQALQEDEERRRNLTKKRFKMYSESASIYVDEDIDLTSCKHHLAMIGHSDQYPTGRYCNYPPHVYMDLADYRETVFPNGNYLGLYSNVAHKIAVNRDIIEAKIAEVHNLKYSRTLVDIMFADYHQRDIDQQKEKLTRSNHGSGLKTRNPEVLARLKKKAETNAALFGQKYRISEMSRINTTPGGAKGVGIGKRTK